MRSLKGQILLASPALVDPNFARSVVLIVRHDDDGALGLVVNHPMALSVADALADQLDAAADCTAPLHLGGPCQGPVFMLHTDPLIGGDEPLSGIYITNDRDAIAAVLREPEAACKIFGSYAGWGVGQLEAELAEKAWSIIVARPADVLSDDPTIWKTLHTRFHLSRYVDPDRLPSDPNMN